MSRKQILGNVLNGDSEFRVVNGPIVCHASAGFAGFSIKRYSTDPDILADSVLNYYKKVKPDAVWINAETLITAESIGQTAAFPGDNMQAQKSGEYLITPADDIYRLSLTLTLTLT